MTIHWHQLTDCTSPIWRRTLGLYDLSFPPEVREPHEVLQRSIQLKASIAPSTFHFLVGTDEDEQVAAFASVHYLSEVNFGFIVYIVVNPLLQNRGIGVLLHRQVEQLLEEDARRHQQPSLRGMILESEREDQVHTE